jgi:hypothetical protein
MKYSAIFQTLAGGHDTAGEYARAFVRWFARETYHSHAAPYRDVGRVGKADEAEAISTECAKENSHILSPGDKI